MNSRQAAVPGVASLLLLGLALSGCASDVVAVNVPAPSASTIATSPRSDASVTTSPQAPNGDVKSSVGPIWQHSGISKAELEAASKVRWFFAHQSVGGNVIKGIRALHKANGLQRPVEVSLDSGTSVPSSGGAVIDKHIGRNGHPFEKLADFDRTLRGGVADQIDAAVLKFCYADVREGRVDVNSVFEQYRQVMSALERDYPNVTFIYATAALKADTPADNVARAQLNSLIRNEYAKTGRLWDLAAIESTTLDGKKIGGDFNGQAYEALHQGFTHDGGHLYERGTELAAAPLLKMLVKAAR